MADYCPQFLRRANLVSEISISFFLSFCLTVDLQMCRQADGAHLRSGCICALNASVDEPFLPTGVGLFSVTPSVLRILVSEIQPVM